MMGKRAQTTIEYAVLIAVTVAGLIAMQVYLKRGMQGRMKTYADQLSAGSTYSPKATNSYSIVTAGSVEHADKYGLDGGVENPRVNVIDSYVSSYKTIERIEETLPFSNEPARK